MGFIPKMSKEEFEWWKEDHKGKFYGLCAGGVCGAIAIVMLLVSAVTPKTEGPAEEETDVVTEIDVEGFDVVEAIEEKTRDQEKERGNRYGSRFSFVPYSLSDENAKDGMFVGATSETGEVFSLYLSNASNFCPVLSAETWNNLFLDNGIYTLRGSFEDIDASIVERWKTEDYQSVVLLFKEHSFNKTTGKEWDKHLQECKVARDYKKNTPESEIADDDLDSIQVEMLAWFTDYLLSINLNGKEISENERSILETYLDEHPLPEYKSIKVPSSPLYVCEKDGVPYGKLSDECVSSYKSLYYATYFANAREEFLNEGDSVSISERAYEDGMFYTLTKPVNFSLQNDKKNEEMVVWLKYENGTQEFYYYPSYMWSTEEGGYLKDYYTVPVSNKVKYFGYFLVGKKYEVAEEAEFDTMLEEKNAWDDGVFSVKDSICYNREDIYGEETVLYLSSFVLSDGPIDLPAGISYLANDTEYTVDLAEEKEKTTVSGFAPGAEVFVDRNHVNTISWKVR